MKKNFLLAFSFCISLISYAQSNQGDYTILKDSTSVEVNETGSGSFSIYKKIKINNEKGVLANHVLTYNYDPLTAFAKFDYVTIYKKDGREINLNVKKTFDYPQPARSIYWNARRIMINVGRLEPGDILEYLIDKKGFTYALLSDMEMKDSNIDEKRFVPPMKGEFYDIVHFWVEQPTISKVYRLSMPRDKDLQYEFFYGECKSSVLFQKDRKVYIFSKSNITPPLKEDYMSSFSDGCPKLILSTTDSFYDKSKWFYKVNEDYHSFDPVPDEQKKVQELIKGKKTEMEKITVLSHWVADHIRYCGLTMGEGEGFTLHNQKMNFTDRCGVCKDIASTLIGCLRIAGIDAYPAMTMVNEHIEHIPADHFNHCVVVVKLKNGTVLPVDPTWIPFTRELWSSAEQQQSYLPGFPEGSDVRVTKLSPPENHYFKVNAKETLNEDGSLTGNLTITAEGQSDNALRRIFFRTPKESWKDAMHQILLKVSPNAKLIDVKWNKNPTNYLGDPILLQFKYKISNYAIKTNDGKLIMKPVTMNNLCTNVMHYLGINTNLKERQFGFNISCTRLVELNEQITLPKGYLMVNSSRNEKSSTNKVIDYTGTLNQTSNIVSINQTISLMKRKYLAQDWKGFSEAVRLQKSFGDYLYFNN